MLQEQPVFQSSDGAHLLGGPGGIITAWRHRNRPALNKRTIVSEATKEHKVHLYVNLLAMTCIPHKSDVPLHTCAPQGSQVLLCIHLVFIRNVWSEANVAINIGRVVLLILLSNMICRQTWCVLQVKHPKVTESKAALRSHLQKVCFRCACLCGVGPVSTACGHYSLLSWSSHLSTNMFKYVYP